MRDAHRRQTIARFDFGAPIPRFAGLARHGVTPEALAP